MDDFRSRLSAALGASPRSDVASMNPLVLAYVGDTVYDLAVRTLLVDTHDAKAHALHVMSARRVRAQAQADVAAWLLPSLTEEEQAVYKRARNAKPHTVPKHASLEDYSAATAFEAVLGFLYLCAREDRLLTLLGLAAHRLEQIVVDESAQKPYKG